MLPSPSRLRLDDAMYRSPGRAELRLVPRENRVAVLLNGNAKRVNAKIKKTFEEVVPTEDLFYCETLEDGQRHAQTIIQRRYDTVMVGGGDGTQALTMSMLLEAAESLSRTGLRQTLPDIGILKLGTGNGLGCVSGAGRPLDDAARVLAGDRPAAYPLPLIRDTNTGQVFPFASMGYDAQVLNDQVGLVADSQTKVGKKFAKSLAGYFYAIGTRTIPTELGAKRAQIRIVSTGRSSIIDPETEEEIPLDRDATLFEGTARAVLFGTSPFYGFALKVLPYANRRTDRFHVRVSSASITFLLSHLPGLWSGKLRSPDFVDFLCEGVRVESTQKLPVQTAGDARGHMDSLDLRLCDRAFRLIDGTGKKA